MIRRQPRSEQQFGSDSFLDIIANIVGILIILIVIVGMKVARQTTEPRSPDSRAMIAEVASAEPPTPTAAAAPVDSEKLAEKRAAEKLAEKRAAEKLAEKRAAEKRVAEQREAEQLLAKRRLLEERERVLAELNAAYEAAERLQSDLTEKKSRLADIIRQSAGDNELTALKVASLQQQMDQSERQQHDLRRDVQQLTQGEADLRQELSVLEQQLQQLDASIAAAEEKQRQTQSTAVLLATETLQLHEVLAEAQSAAESADRLVHRLSPVGERVEKGELHFRVAEGRISYVPLEELLERLKAQVQSRRSTVTRFQRYEGAVGPVQGYRMTYTVERESMSPLESMQYGSGVYRISVSRWTILPDDSLTAEPIATALRPGSRFRQTVEGGLPGSAVTFWLYPDSFSSFASLREIAHGLQLRVAARPLPEGTPIVGSPGGSRSTAQ